MRISAYSRRASGTHPLVTEPQVDEGRRPDGIDDATIEAVGAMSEALEYVERARGELYSFHQLWGHADLLLGEACDKLREAGHEAVANRLEDEVVAATFSTGAGHSRSSRISMTAIGQYSATMSVEFVTSCSRVSGTSSKRT